MLFIVKGKIEISHYMHEGKPDVQHATHPVEAENDVEAEQIFKEHFESMTDEYSVYYSVREVEVFETLSKKVCT